MTDIGAGRIMAAFASLGAAATHLAVAPSHFGDWQLSGMFFFATAVFQAGWALAVMRGAGGRTMAAGLLVNAGSILLWAVSRTSGLPVGPHSGMPEQIDRVDLTTVAFEAAVCVLALWCLWSRHARGFRSSLSAAVVIGAAGAGVAGLALPAVELAGSHSHGHETTDESVPHSHGQNGEHPATPTPGGGEGGTPPTPPTVGETGEPERPAPTSSHAHRPGTAPHDD
ncbi:MULTISPECIES: hypothetical protein [unclassified Parafrankia]|uniref:hypothetical protein n=1 Tax=unclassified Parafrankia TaxID=2994368 RepID=UPI000DA4F1D7|nr:MULTISPECIES: hypothetical protein [unclassified Parafrankia]TCJ33754.1 hypothetical protein E0504_36230 [Parafrankia sp. BMG5.11]SQD97436.1 conserved membrane hypothetical protein [Parafrankia sp. Ea1.12]